MNPLNHSSFRPARAGHALLQDLLFLALLACVAVVLGVATNALRKEPLPFVYQDLKERLAVSLKPLRVKDGPEKMGVDGKAVSHPVQPSVERISVAGARTLLGRPGVLFLDVRSKAHYGEGHIPGALNLPRQGYQEMLPSLFPKLMSPRVTSIVVYCAGGDCDDSLSIAELLNEMQFPSVKVILGGWAQWIQAGQPTTSSPADGA